LHRFFDIQMIIFFRKIPPSTRPNELKSHVEPALKKFIFFQSAKILKAEILILVDKNSGDREYHGLVYLDSDKSGQQVIKKLRGKPFKNRYLMIREFVNRNGTNDPRIRQSATNSQLNKRVNDRRRGDHLETVYDIPKIVNGSDNFSRKLI
jgi:hypothetical protein